MTASREFHLNMMMSGLLDKYHESLKEQGDAFCSVCGEELE